jgi:tetratricopeptide (TPR) repeat protein
MLFKGKEELLSAIEWSDNDIVFLVGSPLSCTYKDRVGVPNVKEILEIVESELSRDSALLARYKKEIEIGLSDADRYQQAFSFLADNTSPNTVNGVIRKSILKAYLNDCSNVDVKNIAALDKLQNDHDTWSIPPATSALATILLAAPNVSKTVLTTNFDPLLSIALAKEGCKPTRIVLHNDSNLEQFHTPTYNIVHLHGFWLNTDTLHNPIQLTIDRPNLKQSLSRILNNKTLVVIGYGGWEDVFTQTLFSLMSDSGADFDILWCFFEKSEDIENKYINLLQHASPAIQRGRFRAFSGINCHEFLPELSKHLVVTTSVQELVSESPKTEKNTILPNYEAFQSKIELPVWKIHLEEAHNHVRSTEKQQLRYLLNNCGYVNVFSDWGMSNHEFIFSLTTEKDTEYFGVPIYKIDIEGLQSKKDLLDYIQASFGFSFPTFIENLPQHKHIVCFDNVDSSLVNGNDLRYYVKELIELASIIVDYNKVSKVVFISKKKLEFRSEALFLSNLQEYDAKAFILNHSCLRDPLDSNTINSIIEIGKGVPSIIEKCIQDLDYLSPEQLYELHYTPEGHQASTGIEVHKDIIKRVETLRLSTERHKAVSYSLLKTLAILERGETFVNIKNSNPSFNYKPTNIKELVSLELLEPILTSDSFSEKASRNDEDKKILKLSTAVRSYIYSKLDNDEVYEIAKNIATSILGPKWMLGILKVDAPTKQNNKREKDDVGSKAVLLVQLLKCAIEMNVGRDIETAFRACRSYCSIIAKKAKHQEVISFSRQIRAILSDSDNISGLSLFYLKEGKSTRMVDNHSSVEAENLLNLALEDDSLSNNYKIEALINLMYIYESRENIDKAREIASSILEIDKKNGEAALFGERHSIEVDIESLKNLEKKYRAAKRYKLANNAAFSLFDLESSNQRKLNILERVLSSEGDDYNRMRAIARKASLVRKDTGIFEPTQAELDLLIAAYLFAYSQKMNSILNQSHQALWEQFIRTDNIRGLCTLYRHSSLYWRIFEDTKRELIYGKAINSLLRHLSPDKYIDFSNIENAYVLHRSSQVGGAT